MAPIRDALPISLYIDDNMKSVKRFRTLICSFIKTKKKKQEKTYESDFHIMKQSEEQQLSSAPNDRAKTPFSK